MQRLLRPLAKVVLVLAGSVALGGAGQMLLGRFQALQHLELQIDRPLRVPLLAPVMVVNIDDRTYERLGDEPSIEPVKRRHLAAFIDALRSCGARALVLDLFLTRPSTDDAAVKTALAHCAPLVVVIPWEPRHVGLDTSQPGGYAIDIFRKPYVTPMIPKPNVREASVIAWEPDSIVRGFPFFVQDQQSGQIVPHAALQVILGSEGKAVDDVHWDGVRGIWGLSGSQWPSIGLGRYQTSWIEKDHPIPTIEFSEALKQAQGPAGASAFRGQIVVLSATTEGARSDDLQSTPIGPVPGGQVLAHFINSLYQGPDRQVVGHGRAVTVLAGAVTAFGLLLLMAKPSAGRALQAALYILVMAIGVVHFRHPVGGTIALVPVSMAAGGAILACLTAVGVRQTDLLERYLPRYVRDQLALRGDRRACVLFVDMAGSTATIQGKQIGEAASLLSDVLHQILLVVPRFGGHVETTMGDGAMVMFYADELPDYREKCIQTMRSLQVACLDARQEFSRRYGAELKLTMGAESGEVTGRVLKAAKLEEFSLFGMTIHLAARLQSAAGHLGRTTALGPDLASHFQDDAEFVEDMELKGIGLTKIYALRDLH